MRLEKGAKLQIEPAINAERNGSTGPFIRQPKGT